MPLADVELSITRSADGTTAASLRAELPNRRADLVRGVTVTLDETALRSLTTLPSAYSAALTEMIFVPSLREAWQRIRGFGEGEATSLRMRLVLEGNDALHTIRWELLRDPIDQAPLAHSERVRLSRFLSSTSLADMQIPARPDLRAVVAVASPAELSAYGLAPVDVEGEVTRVGQGLGDIPAVVLDGQEGRPRATLPAIAGALRDGAHILYLVCHGKLTDQGPIFWLEQEGDKQGKPIAGDELVQTITNLEHRPLLVVLASCQGAGDTYQMLAALGPRLARAGVGAVLAMQGNVPMELVAQLTPTLFAELRRDGQIDRALAVARSALPTDSPWWMPVLWMVVRDGSLWGVVEQAPISRQLTPRLRAPVADFVGREQQLSRLVEAIARSTRNGGPTLAAIRGMGGAGKTELAHAIAYRLGDVFPDGAYLIDLRGSGAQPLQPIQALQTLIHAVQPSERLDDDLPTLERHYHTVLHGRHLLIVVDDARDAAQVRALIPPPGCGLLITSRQRFTLPGLQEVAMVDLDGLAPDAAEALLLQICGRIGAHAPLLARRCGYLPLALRVSASLLANDPTIAVTRFLDQLSDTRGRLAAMRDPDDPALDVEASLALSYDRLSPPLQHVLRQLSVFPADTGRDAIVNIVALAAEESLSIDEALSALYRRSLVAVDVIDERYRLHDLVLAFAQARLSSEELTTLRERHARYFLGVAQALQPGKPGPGHRERLSRLDREYPHLQAALAWAQHDENPDLGLDLIIALGPYWDTRGMWAEGRAWCEALLARGGATTLYGRAYGRAANLAERQGDVPQAMTWGERRLTLARQEGDGSEEAAALRQLAEFCRLHGNEPRALALYEESLTVARSIHDRRAIMVTLNRLGAALRRLGDDDRARACYAESLDLARSLDDRTAVAWALSGLGKLARERGALAEASRWYAESLEVARVSGDRNAEALAHEYLAQIAEAQGDYETAAANHQSALTAYRDLGYQSRVARSLVDLGLVQYARGWHRDAATAIGEGFQMYQNLGQREGMAWSIEVLLAGSRERLSPQRSLALLAAAEALREMAAAPRPPEEQARFAQRLAELRGILNETTFTELWAAGRVWKADEVARVVTETVAALTTAPVAK